MPSNACTPSDASCHTSTDACLAVVENVGAASYVLRMAYVQPIKPNMLATGIISNVFTGAVLPNEAVCNLNGVGTTNFLLGFDTAAATLKLGSSKPVSSPAGPFTYETDVVNGLDSTTFTVQPVVLNASADGGCGFTTDTGDVNLPIYLDGTGTSELLLPMHAVGLSGVVSTDQSCIGAYDVTAQDPNQSCMPDSTHPAFNTGGELTGYIVLEEADSVYLSQVNQTLCLLLSGDATTYGTGATPDRCKRDTSNAIIFQGDWCSSTNAPADASCADAMRVDIPFAASGVTAN